MNNRITCKLKLKSFMHSTYLSGEVWSTDATADPSSDVDWTGAACTLEGESTRLILVLMLFTRSK